VGVPYDTGAAVRTPGLHAECPSAARLPARPRRREPGRAVRQ